MSIDKLHEILLVNSKDFFEEFFQTIGGKCFLAECYRLKAVYSCRRFFSPGTEIISGFFSFKYDGMMHSKSLDKYKEIGATTHSSLGKKREIVGERKKEREREEE